MTPNPLLNLEPHAVWTHFATLCAIPRPSKHEGAVRTHLLDRARRHRLDAAVDSAGNLLVRKDATPGSEDRPGVVLQGHLDMVCQKNAHIAHDFLRDPIRPELADAWVVARDTTLGADNGIGVALALAALEDPGLVHPPLEVLLTVDEEDGMGGAHGLAPASLRGRYLINLDTEEWGSFYLGCAGGMDVEATRDCHTEPVPSGWQVWRTEVGGLRGGHSGIDIHLGRGNAIRLMAEWLRELTGSADMRLLGLEGGTARNAIPREASAVIALPPEAADSLAELAAAKQRVWQAQFKNSDPGIKLTCRPVPDTGRQAAAGDDRLAVLDFLLDAPNGVRTLSPDFPGVVETSDNLGVARLAEGICHTTLMVRSLRADAAESLAEGIVRAAQGRGCEARKLGAYPGWTPDPGSPLLASCRRVYEREFGEPARLQVIHAGLECGILAASHPGLDMISFGPDIRGAHAPGERVEVASVQRAWRLLRAILQSLAEPG